MLNDKPNYGKINCAYTLVTSGGHTRADDQTKPYPSCYHLLTLRKVDSRFLAFCRHFGDVRTQDK